MVGHFIHGDGPVRAIVLHGWLGDWSVFAPMLPALDPTVFSLAFMDCRGYGASKAAPGPYDMATVAADAERLADELKWSQFAVVGHSMGGKAALQLAVNASERVTRILALNPVWAGPAPFDTDTLAFFRGAAGDIALRVAILDNTTGGRLPKAWSAGLASKSVQTSTCEAFAAYFESWALGDFAQQARNLSHETLVVVGGQDTGVTEADVRASWLAELPNARLHVLPESGHYPMLEAPPLLAALFERFLASEVR